MTSVFCRKKNAKGVGKTALRVAFVDEEFGAQDAYVPSQLAEHETTSITVGDDAHHRVKLDLHDLPGTLLETAKAPNHPLESVFRGADGVVLAFDAHRRATLDRLDQWLALALAWTGNPSLHVTVVACQAEKADGETQQEEKRLVLDQGRRWADQRQLLFFPTSAKGRTNVDKVFEHTAAAILHTKTPLDALVLKLTVLGDAGNTRVFEAPCLELCFLGG